MDARKQSTSPIDDKNLERHHVRRLEQYKLRILAEYERRDRNQSAVDTRAMLALIRWRKQRDQERSGVAGTGRQRAMRVARARACGKMRADQPGPGISSNARVSTPRAAR